MPIPTLPPYSTPPSSTDPANFAARADVKVAQDVIFVDTMNASVIPGINQAVDDVEQGLAETEAAIAAANANGLANAAANAAAAQTARAGAETARAGAETARDVALQAAADAEAAAGVIPPVTGNAGKFLRVNSGASGVEWVNVPPKRLYEAYLTSGTSWVAPAGCTEIVVEGVGGGGGGSSQGTVANHNVCGGFGGYFRARRAVTPGQNCAYAIGAGGASVTNALGPAGGTTTFTVGAETFTASGGSGAAVNGGAGGNASGGDVNIRGPRGANGVTGTTPLYVSVTGHMGGWHVNRGTLTYSIAEAQGGPGSGGVSVSSGASNAGGAGAIRITYLAD